MQCVFCGVGGIAGIVLSTILTVTIVVVVIGVIIAKLLRGKGNDLPAPVSGQHSQQNELILY